ncbi:hypothetical protein N2152v2_001204 [Parachlorella kessleri]
MAAAGPVGPAGFPGHGGGRPWAGSSPANYASTFVGSKFVSGTHLQRDQQGSCGFGYCWPDIGTGWDVAAIADASPEFAGSCGSVEVLNAALQLATEQRQGQHIQWLCWDLQVMPSRYINACTDGIGRLWVSSGLIEHLGFDGSGQGQLAAVLAHEVAHNMARHAAKLKQARLELLPSTVFQHLQAKLFAAVRADMYPSVAAIPSLSPLKTVAGVLGALQPPAVLQVAASADQPQQPGRGIRSSGDGNSSFSERLEGNLDSLRRRLENEADVLALSILARSGRLPGHMIAYLQDVKAWEDATPACSAGQGAHPAAWQRVEVARRHLPAAARLLAARCPSYAAWRACSAASPPWPPL